MAYLSPMRRLFVSQIGGASKTFHSARYFAAQKDQKKILLILYTAGKHAKDEPKLLGCIENELGLRQWIEGQGHKLVTTASKDGENSDLDKHIVDAEIVITTPFHPGYITRERIAKAKNLKVLHLKKITYGESQNNP